MSMYQYKRYSSAKSSIIGKVTVCSNISDIRVQKAV